MIEKVEKKYKIIHVVTDKFDENCIYSTSNLHYLYKNKKENELFVKIFNEKKIINSNVSKNIVKFSYVDFINGEFLNKTNCDFVFFHSPYVLSGFCSEIKAKKILVLNGSYIHNIKELKSYENQSKDLFWSAHNNADEIVVTTNEEREILQGIVSVAKILEKKITIIPNGVEVPIIKKLDMNNSKKIGYLGGYELKKGIVQLMEQMKYIEGYNLFVASDSHKIDTSILNNCIKTINSNPRSNIFPLGNIEGKRKVSFFSDMEIIIIPSLCEDFSLVLLQSIIEGKIIFINKTKAAVDVLGIDYPLYYDAFRLSGLRDVIKKYENMSLLSKEKIIKDNHKKINNFSIKKTINMYRNYRYDLSFDLKSPEYGVRLI
jgi:hypothetical protein